MRGMLRFPSAALSPGNFLALFHVRFNVLYMYFYSMYLQELFHHRISIHEFVLNFVRSNGRYQIQDLSLWSPILPLRHRAFQKPRQLIRFSIRLSVSPYNAVAGNVDIISLKQFTHIHRHPTNVNSVCVCVCVCVCVGL